MNEGQALIYWDSNVFLSYINGIEERLPTIDALLEEASNEDAAFLFTSTISKVEVAYAASEQAKGKLDASVESAIEHLWEDYSVVKLVEFHDDIASIARDLLRYSIAQRWRLKPMDAIHLASAKWMGADEFHTYDRPLEKYAGETGCKIIEPYVRQGRLPSI